MYMLWMTGNSRCIPLLNYLAEQFRTKLLLCVKTQTEVTNWVGFLCKKQTHLCGCDDNKLGVPLLHCTCLEMIPSSEWRPHHRRSASCQASWGPGSKGVAAILCYSYYISRSYLPTAFHYIPKPTQRPVKSYRNIMSDQIKKGDEVS